MFLLFYSILFPIVFLFYLPFYAVHFIRRGGLTVDFWERFGIFPAAVKKRLKALKAPVWLHAVSVGETVEAISFIQIWLQRHPDEELVFSCGTSTAFATALKKMPPQVVVIYCPLDCWWMVRHALNLVRPRLLAIFEVEIWPQLIRQAARRGVKVVLVNGRMSDKSSAGYARWGFIFRPIFRSFAALCMQTEDDAARVRRVIGEDVRIHAVGTVKFDQIPDKGGQDTSDALTRAFGDSERLVFCAGSTHPGEEALMCRAIKEVRQACPSLKMVLVPRHAERGAEVVKVIEGAGLTWQSVKLVEGASPCAAPVDVLLVNTTGQLTGFYQTADICFVGKSLCGQSGGHNIIEAAIFAKAIIYGSHMENFRQVDAIFQAEKAGLVVDGDEAFIEALKNLATNAAMRAELGTNARRTVDRHRGAIARTLDIIDALPQSAV